MGHNMIDTTLPRMQRGVNGQSFTKEEEKNKLRCTMMLKA